MTTKILEKLIKKRLKQHQEERDFDGFACCSVRQQREMRVATKTRWRGTEEQRQKALKEQDLMDKQIHCDFCSLCAELIQLIKNDNCYIFYTR